MQTLGHNRSLPSATVVLAVALALSACREQADSAPASGERPSVSESNSRLPAVAGLFYPREAKALAAAIDRYLAAAPTNPLPGIKALLCPHAGYEYSGPTAAYAYQLVAGGDYDTVVLLAPSHYASFVGASIPAANAYETPLGRVPVSPKVGALAKTAPFVVEPKCFVQRPQWSGAAPKPEPAAGQDTPDTWEHSAEVQIPFLQRTLKDFKILPVIFGRVDPEQVARALVPLVDDRTLVVASTDLSHYESYEDARRRDRQTVQWIRDLNIQAFESAEAEGSACGRMPVIALLHLAKLKGWTPQPLDYRNSGDTAGDKRRVVGYAAVAFTVQTAAAAPGKGAGEAKPGAQFGAVERTFLLNLARQALQQATSNGALPQINVETVPVSCRVARGCFVTLTKAGDLRGCIGNILPAGPLYRAVLENARNAALRDPRFPVVTAAEAGTLRIEISVLSVPEPLTFALPDDLLAKLQPRRDGVVLQIGERSATFLPQVWEQLPDKADFLGRLAQKAGCPSTAWRGSDVKVSVYRVEAFAETQ